MKRCILITALILGCLALASGHIGQSGNSCAAQNVILIVVDTLAAQNLGCMGYQRDTSPFIDELANRSVIFDKAYTPKSTTVPSVTSLFSGLHPSRHGILENGGNLPDDLHFLTDDFRKSGFTTWGVPAARVLGAQYGLSKGFDYYANTPAIPHPASRVIERIDRILTGKPALGEPDFTKTRKPLFLFIHFYDPHTEYTPDPAILENFTDPDYSGIANGTWEQFEKYNNYEIEFSAADIRHSRDLYDAEIRTFDDRARELFELFDRVGLIDNSIIVFTADHGENLGEHHFFTHGHPYEPSLHIPLIIHFPEDRWAGTRIEEIVENTDIMPTLMDLADVKIPENLSGRTLLPLIDNSVPYDYEARECLFAIGDSGGKDRTYSICDGMYRLTVDISSSGEVDYRKGLNLFDIVADPKESVDIADTDHNELIRLAPLLTDYLTASNDPVESEISPDTRAMLLSIGYIQN